MKKVILFLILLVMPLCVRADNINDVDIKINIREDGTADIEEVWGITALGLGAFCKYNSYLGGVYIRNYGIYVDNELLWYSNLDRFTFFHNSNTYGSYFYDNRWYQCFGRKNFQNDVYTIKYTIDDYIFNTDDGQVLYWSLLSDFTGDNVSVEISSYECFSNDVDLKLYGIDDEVTVYNGNIYISSSDLKNDYIVLLVKFPIGTFNTSYKIDGYNMYDDFYQHAENGDYIFINVFDYMWLVILIILIIFILVLIIRKFVIKRINILNGYGYSQNKIINEEEVPIIRDIPSDMNINYAFTLIKLNNLDNGDGNILGAIILKWLRDKKIVINHVKVGKSNKDVRVIDLTLKPIFDSDLEIKLFKMMYEASNNGLLEAKEFKEWAKNYDMKFLGLLSKVENDVIKTLKADAHIYHRITKNECKRKYVMDDKIYNDSVKLCGLKKFLLEFSNMDVKEIKEIYLWNEYLMYAYLFGIADKMEEQISKLALDIDEIDVLNLMN